MPSNLISKKKTKNAAWLDEVAIDAGQRSGFLSHKEKKVSKYGEKKQQQQHTLSQQNNKNIKPNPN